MDETKRYYVAGEGIYQFSMLPKSLQVYHNNPKDAQEFIKEVAKVMDQSFLYFNVYELEKSYE